jgi:hypothetical protein
MRAAVVRVILLTAMRCMTTCLLEALKHSAHFLRLIQTIVVLSRDVHTRRAWVAV